MEAPPGTASNNPPELTAHSAGIVEKARQEGRIVLVHGLSFGELVAASGARLPSVITFRLRNIHPDHVNDALQSILSQHGEALEQGTMISVTEGQVRVRRLPLSL